MAQISTTKCDVCEKDTGQLFCYEWRHFLCQSCKHYHDKFQKKHTVTDSHNVDRLALSKQLTCEEHKEDFVHFCLRCDCLICSSCVTTAHRGHSLTQISEVVSQARENVKANIGQLKKKIKTLTDLIEPIKATKLNKIKDESKLFSSEVEKTSEHIISIVNSVKEIDITRASDFLVLEKQQLEFTIAKLEKVYKEHVSVSSQLEQVLQLKHDIAFFLNQRTITKQIGDLDDIPRVEEPNEIGKFNKEDFAKAVVKQIQSHYNIGDEEVGTDIFKCTTQKKETEHRETHDRDEDVGTEQFQCTPQKKATYREPHVRDEDVGTEQFQCTPQKKATYREPHVSYAGRLFSAAIDIGSTYSGYTYSSKDDYQEEPTKINTNVWTCYNLKWYKAPTAVLFDNDQQFIAFGYEAEDKYSDLVEEGEHEDYYYFPHFKMLIHDRSITRDIKIKDAMGRELEALTVFQYCIQYLKDHLYRSISDLVKGIQEHDIHYVLTVPAIWSDSGAQFMKVAALKAGIKDGQLSIALEQDAATQYWQNVKTGKQGTKDMFLVTKMEGTKYMVIDLGGATADITCHQRSKDGTLKEVVPPSGGPWGGRSIDEAFCTFLNTIFGPKIIDKLHTCELFEYIDLFREFETKKKSITVDRTHTVIFRLPSSLWTATALKWTNEQRVSKNKLFIHPDAFRSLFTSTGDALVKHLGKIFKDEKLSDLKTVIMVGGFSECELMQHRIKERFGNDRNILIPEEAGLAVLKGAVMLGHQVRSSRRVLRLTYGIRYWHKWDSQLHPQDKRIKIGEHSICEDFFLKFVRADQRVRPGYEVSFVLTVLNTEDRNPRIAVFTSPDRDPRYVTDTGCQRLGDMTIPLGRDDRLLKVEVSMIFGDTKLLVRARDCASGRVVETELDLL